MLKIILILGLASLALANPNELKINGDAHFHYSIEDTDNNSFNLSRAYLSIQKTINPYISYKFQTDVGPGGGTDYSVYLKNAKLDWKTDFGKLTFGLQGLNMFKVQENTWAYRFIEKTVMDRNKYSSSADLGIGWQKSFGNLSPSLMITNGTGYKKGEDDGYKKVSFRLLYGESKLKSGFNTGFVLSTESKDYTNLNTTQTGRTVVLGGFGGIAIKDWRVGAEYAMRSLDMATEIKSNVFSVYGSYHVNSKFTGFGRFDLVDPDMNVDSDGNNYFVGGASYQADKVFYIAPNIKVKIPEKGKSENIYQISLRFKV